MAEGSSDTRQSNPPTLLKLKELKGADGKPLKIVQKIAAHDYATFGMYLLQDENGEEVDLIEKDHINKGGAEAVTKEILKKWLTGDAPTRTYQHLIECLRQSELGALAELIEKTSLGLCCSDNMSSVSEVNDIASYASYLKRRYNDMSQTLTAQHWSHLPQCEYIQLAMINCKRRRHEFQEEKIREKLAQEGKVKPILDTKEPIELDGLFSTGPLVVLPPPLPKPRVILLEAAPGGGKSTLALHICHQWAQGASFLKRFDIVILAYLRDSAIQNAKHLVDILPADVLVSQKQIASEIIACRGKNVLFIFDGWDEFPSKLRHSSVVSDIIRKSYGLPLDDCTILITSRSESSLDLHDIANRRVEILGFTQERIREYIRKALVKNDGNNTRVHELVQHLKNHPVIESYCYVPLHAAILVHVFLTKNGALPTTLHELFSIFLLCCIVRELKIHDKIIFEVSSLEKLPDDLNRKLNDLRLLAYKGVIQNKALFYEKDLLELNLPPELKSFGLLQSVEGLTISSTSVSYNFLHLSVQEHLAAYYISKLSSAEQVEVFKNLFQDHASRFQAVLHHYSGLTKLVNSEVQYFISEYSERQSSFKDILPLLHCFYEAQQPSVCKLLGLQFSDIDLWYSQLDPVDYLVIGYFITSLLSTTDVSLTLRRLDEHRLKLLLVELCKQGGNKELKGRLRLIITSRRKDYQPASPQWNITSSVIEKIRIFDKRPEWEQLFTHLEKLPFINELTIGSSDVQMKILTDSMLQNNCHLTKLRLTDNYRLPDPVQSITAMLHSTKLTHLNLSGTPISDEGACCVFRCLQDNNTLLNLKLSNIGIKLLESTVQELLSMLKNNKTLTHLDLSNNLHYIIQDGDKIKAIRSLSVNLARTVFQGLCHNTTLAHLNLSHMNFDVSDETGKALITMLQVNKTLTHLDLSQNNEFSESGAFCLFQGLQLNTALVYLDLKSTAIRYNAFGIAGMLSNMLQVNKTLQHLELSDSDILFLRPLKVESNFIRQMFLSDTFIRIFQGLQTNTSLHVVYLELRSTIIRCTEATTQALATMLQVNRTLTHLHLLSINIMHSFEIHAALASCIWKALMHNTTLTHLTLSQCDLSHESNNLALTTMLQVNKTLTHLDLSRNNIFTDSGAQCICLGLQHNTALVSLNLSGTNLIGDQTLATMLQVNKTLTHLDLSFNTFTDSGFHYVCQGLQHNTALLHLNLRWTNLTDKGAEYIAQVLHSNRSLQTLNISRNPAITDDGFALIAESLKTNKTLKTLYIDDCSITPRLAKTVYQAKFK